jgi:IS5 family transposase
MLRIEADTQMNLWETVLPAEIFKLNEELTKVDALLDDEAFILPFIEKFSERKGRPSVPVETYLRLMYLKVRYELGYETLVSEVSDSLKWRKFCRIPLEERVPDSTTLIKLTRKYGETTVSALNEALIKKAKEERIVRGKKLRVDTTAVASDISYPTDADLLADGVDVITREAGKLAEAGKIKKVRNRTRSAKRRLLDIAKHVKRRSDAKAEARAITRKIVAIAESAVADVTEALESIKDEGDQTYRKLKKAVDVTKRIIEQTNKVEAGLAVKERIVSVVDEDARPISRGKREMEFGSKTILSETEERIIVDYDVLLGNPNDETLLEGALTRTGNRLGKVPQEVATDRGFASPANEAMCVAHGVKRVSLPKRGKLSKKRRIYQQQYWFKRLQRFRAGGEATISLLKRKYGLRRTLLRGHDGAKIWVGLSVLTYNLRRLAVLAG